MTDEDIYKLFVQLDRIEMKINNIQNRVYDILEWIYPPKKEESEATHD